MGAELPDLCRLLVEGLELFAGEQLPPAARILKRNFGRLPLVPFEGGIRQDWGALQAAHRGRDAAVGRMKFGASRARQRFAAAIKACVGDRQIVMQSPVRMGKSEAMRRLKITINAPAASGLMVLPPFDGNLDDKICLLKGYAKPAFEAGGPIAPGAAFIVGEPGPAPLVWPAPAEAPKPRPHFLDLPLGRPTDQ